MQVQGVRLEVVPEIVYSIQTHHPMRLAMAALMDQDTFRTALEKAIAGKSANKSPFSLAWASGKLSRAHLARWCEDHYHYVGPFADYLVPKLIVEHEREIADFERQLHPINDDEVRGLAENYLAMKRRHLDALRALIPAAV